MAEGYEAKCRLATERYCAGDMKSWATTKNYSEDEAKLLNKKRCEGCTRKELGK